MKKNRFCVVVAALLFALLFNTCKKYDEGGFHMWAKHNLLSHDGKWSLEKYEVNGIDSTDYVITNNDLDLKKNFMTIAYESRQYYIFIKELNLYTFNFMGKDQFIGGSKSISGRDSINQNLSIRRIFCPTGQGITWKIIRLKSKEFVLKYVENNEYILKFKANK